MKAIKYFLYTLIATFVFAGCSDDPTYTRGESEADGCYGVYFPAQDNAADLELDPADPTVLTFTAMRTNDTDAITVPVTVTGSEAEIFSASEISFDDGATETTFQVSFPNAEIGTPYSCNIQINDKKYAFIYGEKASGVSFSVTRVKWNPVIGEGGETMGKWRDDIVSSAYGLPGVYAECDRIEFFERDDKPGYYRIIDTYSPYFLSLLWPPYSPEDLAENCQSTINYIDATDPEKVWFPIQTTGVTCNSSDGPIGFASTVKANFPDRSTEYFGKMENGIITFPKGGLSIQLGSSWYHTAGNSSGLLRIMMPGVKAYDYSLALSASEPADGKVEIAAKLGANVAKVKYAFFEGVFGDAIAKANSAGIDAGTVESKEITADGTIVAELEETGKYTIVANIYDEAGELQKYEFLSFGYVKAGDDKPVVLSVRTELTWEFEAQGHTPENSIRGILFGENIESGYMGLFQFSELEGKSSEDLIEIAKTSGKAITAEEIDKINDTGLSLLYTDLIGGTDYVLLVWANNGYYSKLMYSMTTTEGTPHPLKRTFTVDDLMATQPTKADYINTAWDYYAINGFKGGSRAKIGKVVITENTEDDIPAQGENEAVDYVNIKGLFGGGVAQIGGDDTMLFEYYKGLLYAYTPERVGMFQSYYIVTGIIATNNGVYPGDGLLLGGLVEDGYVAFVSLPGIKDSETHEIIDFSGFYFGAYSTYDQATDSYSGFQGGLVWQDYPMFVDPAKATSSVSAPVASDTFSGIVRNAGVKPANFVELRGRERIHALIDEYIGKSKPVNRITTALPVDVPALGAVKAKVEFREGVAAPGEEITRKIGAKITK